MLLHVTIFPIQTQKWNKKRRELIFMKPTAIQGLLYISVYYNNTLSKLFLISLLDKETVSEGTYAWSHAAKERVEAKYWSVCFNIHAVCTLPEVSMLGPIEPRDMRCLGSHLVGKNVGKEDWQALPYLIMNVNNTSNQNHTPNNKCNENTVLLLCLKVSNLHVIVKKLQTHLEGQSTKLSACHPHRKQGQELKKD